MLQGQRVTLLFPRSFANLLLLSYRAIPKHAFPSSSPPSLRDIFPPRINTFCTKIQPYHTSALSFYKSTNISQVAACHETKAEKASGYPDFHDGSPSRPRKLLAIAFLRLGEEGTTRRMTSACILWSWAESSPARSKTTQCLVLASLI